MTNRSDDSGTRKREALLRLADAHAADVFAATRAEIMEDAVSQGVDPKVVGRRMRDMFDKAELEVGKAALSRARAAVDRRARAVAGNGKRMAGSVAANDAGMLTLAARGLTDMSERDRKTVQEDYDEIAELLAEADRKP